jgi:hypothetical protein
MKSRFSTALIALVALGSSALSALAGAPTNTSVQVFKGTIKSQFQTLDASEEQKGNFSSFAYYIQSRSEGQERLLVVNHSSKVFFVENSSVATFTLANNNTQMFSLRTNDLAELLNGTGSLLGKVKPGTFNGVTIDFYTPVLNYEFHSFGSSSFPYVARHDKATFKIDKAMMNLIYADGATNVSDALTDVINFLDSKGYVGLP